ncbi:hypothetical protein EAS62_08565 [Bradyrhizobium zhanjiangense]|uniref:Uncharacterized protein n=1 Tax=Bradyrhizobium zhanjiangense TaxID=1325107 RepID=A0ABY0DQS4_9BRAD|nr:hypothetical protein EAS62_08565 [Bradyrhizobium zhanjiangense]
MGIGVGIGISLAIFRRFWAVAVAVRFDRCLPWDAAKANPSLSVRAAAAEMEIAASRRDLHSAIACAGSERDGLAPPSKLAEGTGRISMRKRRDFSPMSSALTFIHQARPGEIERK